MSKAKRHKVVEIEWIDSTSLSKTWHPSDDALKTIRDLPPCRAAGFLIHQDKKWTILATLDSSWSTWGVVTAIPTGCIQKVRRLT